MNLTALKEELIRDEGLRLKPYRDTVGKLTIGVGRNLDDVGITKDEAMHLLAAAAGWRIICIGKDADIRRWRGTRGRFCMLTTLYALMFYAIAALLLDIPLAKHLAIVTMAAWLFVRRNPFER